MSGNFLLEGPLMLTAQKTPSSRHNPKPGKGDDRLKNQVNIPFGRGGLIHTERVPRKSTLRARTGGPRKPTDLERKLRLIYQQKYRAAKKKENEDQARLIRLKREESSH